MWPPMPSSSRLARTTMAIAFQRTRLLIRRSISRLPGYGHLFVGGDGVDVRGVGGERQLDAGSAARGCPGRASRRPDAGRSAVLEHVVQRIEPFAGFEGFELGGVCRSSISHSRCMTLLRRRFGNRTIVLRVHSTKPKSRALNSRPSPTITGRRPPPSPGRGAIVDLRAVPALARPTAGRWPRETSRLSGLDLLGTAGARLRRSTGAGC